MHVFTDIIASDADRFEAAQRRDGGVLLRLRQLGEADVTINLFLTDLVALQLEQVLAEHRQANTNIAQFRAPSTPGDVA